VDNLNLSINDKEIFGFIGHNGAGKTTTIKSLAGILEFEEGEFILDGISLRKDPIGYKSKMAYIPDNPDIYEGLTAIQYLNFVGNMYKMNPDKKRDNIEKYAKYFDIYPCLGDPIAGFSHGMKQKIVLISAFMHDPKLIVLDEPFVGLDPKATFELKQLMRNYCDEGNCILFSTHVLDTAEKVSDKIAIIKSGKIMKIGTTKEVIGDKTLEETFLEVE
jgi:ABC-2 type transport system ATP-binding protein